MHADAQDAPPEQAAGEVVPQGDESLAQVHFEAGRQYYDRGEYTNALREFTRSYELSHRGELNYNISLCHQGLEDFAQAIAFLERYLAEVADAPNRSNLERRLQSLRERRAAREAEVLNRETQARTTELEDPGGFPLATFVSFLAGGLGFAAQLVFGVLALVEESSVAEGCGLTASCSEDQVAAMDTFALASDIGLSVGAAGAVFGVVFLLSVDGD